MDALPFFLEEDKDSLVYILEKIESQKPVHHVPEKSEDPFVFEDMSDDFCWLHFRFYKEDLIRLKIALDIPNKVKCGNGVVFSGIEGLCILLKRLIYPSRYADLMKFFPRTRCEISRIFNKMVSIVIAKHSHLLTDMDQPWLSLARLEEFTDALKLKGCPYRNCFVFLDGTVRPICRPIRNQRQFYNGHKRTHSIKFQAVSYPNGLIGHLHGPVHGRRHDSYLLETSGIIRQMEQRFITRTLKPFHLYGDPAYPLHPHLITPFQRHSSTPARLSCNKRMSSILVSVEWGFGKVIRHFGFLDFRKNLRIGLQAVHRYYQVGSILTNCHTCVYGSQTTAFFDYQPPDLEMYLN